MTERESDKSVCFVRVPIAELTKPRPGFLLCMTDRWWVVTDNDEVLFYRKKYQSPQCNDNKSIAERLRPEGTTVRFIPMMFLPVSPQDYA